MARPPAEVDVFSVIGHPRRREIMAKLAAGDRGVTDLVGSLGLSQSTVSEHLAMLHAVGLVQGTKRGRERIYRLDMAPLRDVTEWIDTLDTFWSERISRLGQLLETIDEGEAHEPDLQDG